MATYREIIYMVLDELKITSDDALFNEEHIKFLLTKYRGMILKQQYKDVKKEIPESNFQTLCLNLEEVSAIPSEPCEGGSYLRSTETVPFLMSIISPRLYAEDYFQGDITYVSKERMRFVGHNKWLSNIIYASLGPDNYLYLKSSNPQYLYLEKIQVTGVFEDPEEAAQLECCNNECDIMDVKFPLEEALIPTVIELIVKELSRPEYLPEDKDNNADDDLSDVNISKR